MNYKPYIKKNKWGKKTLQGYYREWVKNTSTSKETSDKLLEVNANIINKNVDNSPHSQPPQSLPAGLKTGTSSKYINDILQIQSTFVNSNLQCTVKDAILLRDNQMQFEGMKDIPAWTRPTILNPRQNEIIDAICDPSVGIVACEGDKRTGKSTAYFMGICEGVWSGIFKKVGLWASGEENALGILNDVYRDDITVKSSFPLFKGMGSRSQKVFFNNALIKAFSNNAASTSGLDFDVCWIDECHEVVVEHPEVFDMILMTMRAKPNIKLILSMNKGTGTYHIFKDTLLKEFSDKEVKFFTLEKKDTTHITDEADHKVRTLVKAVGGKDEVSRWLDNKAVTASTFDPRSVIDAYESYEAFTAFNTPTAAYTVLSYDPSGAKHPKGLSCWSCDIKGENFWMRSGEELRLGEELSDIATGEKLTPEQIKLIIIDRARKYAISMFISESNMDGKDMVMNMKLAGFMAKNQNFSSNSLTTKGKGASRGAMCNIVRTIMDDRALYFNNELLKNEWMIYDPDEHEKVAKYKGDLADSAIHAIYKLARMSSSKYIPRRRSLKYQEVSQNG